MKLSSERGLLPVLRNPFMNWDETTRLLIPMFQLFLDSELDIDYYGGWAFSLKFIKNSNIEYQDAVASMDMSKCVEKFEWVCAPSIKDRAGKIMVYKNTAIVIHLESWLWFE